MTWPGLGGLQPPPGNAPPAGTLVPGVQPGTTPGIVLAQYVIVFGTAGGVFVYSGTPASGNPPIFWATSASTDPYGNSILSTAGVGGTGSFRAGDTIINPNGIFVYSGTPSSSTLILSLCPTATTDPFGTSAAEGFSAYIVIAGTTYVVSLGESGGVAGVSMADQASAPAVAPIVGSAQASSTGTAVILYSGASTVSAVGSQISLLDSLFASVTNGLIEMLCGQVTLGKNSTAVVNDNSDQVTLGQDSAVMVDGANNRVSLTQGSLTSVSNNTVAIPAAGGPFIAGESFHSVSLPSSGGFTGSIRVKLLPWNAVFLDVAIQWTGTSSTTYTCGSLPSSSYYPTASHSFPISMGDTPTAGSTFLPPRIIIPTSGAVTIFTPASSSGSGTTANCGISTMYPTN